MLTIGDLAIRWQVSVAETIQIVRKRGVPFVSIHKRPDMRVCWEKVRFRESDIEAWEEDQRQTHPSSASNDPHDPSPAYIPPATSRLGKW